MEKEFVQVLLIEDNLGDAKFINEMINESRDFHFRLDHAFRLSSGLEFIQKKKYDVILLDLGLPDSFGLETLQEVHSAAERIPIVIMTGLDDEELGLKAVQLGAQDYIVKLQIDTNLLVRSIRYAIERKKISQNLAESQANLAEAQKLARIGNYEVSINGEWVSGSEEAYRIFGRDRSMHLSNLDEYIKNIIHPEDQEDVKCMIEKVKSEKVSVSFDFRAILPNGGVKYVHNIIRPVIENSGEIVRFFGIVMDVTEQKLSQKALVESEEITRAVFEQAAVGIVLVLPNKRIFNVNERFCQITGYSREELLKLTFVQITHPEDQQKDLDFLEKIFEKEISAFSTEKRYIRKDGFYIWVNLTVSPIYGSNGELKYYLGVIQDITERRWAEEARLQSEETAHAFMNAITDSALITDLSGLIISANETAAKRSGRTSDRYIGTNYFDYLPEELAHDRRKRIEQILITRKPIRFEDERSGRTIDNIFYPIFDSRGEVTRVAILAIDVTERKVIETALRESEQRLSTVFKESPSPIAILRLRDNVFLDVNAAFENMTGFSSSEILNKDMTKFKMFSNQQDRLRIFEMIKNQGEIRNYETNLIVRDGRIVTGLLSAIKIVVNGEESLVIVVHDITERKKALEQIERYVEELKGNKDLLEESARELSMLNRKLNESNVNKDKFFSILAHDLRSPFSALLGFAEFLTNHLDELSQDEVRDFSQRIYRSLNNLFKLIENLLQWSRIQTGRIDYSPAIFDLHNLAVEILDVYHVNITQKALNVINQIAQGTLVFADRDMIDSVVANLLSNAIKFTPHGGRIILEARAFDSHYQVSVTDSGVGISAENLKRLFKIEETLTTEGTEKEKGTGLGLILCREFIEINHGTITAESEPGKWSRFTITLPRA